MTRFRRLVLELGHGAVDSETMRQAATFAHLMDAELHALFVEDETLLHASALPFAREINPLSYQWRPLERDRLETELRAAADRARQQLIEAAGAIGVPRSFEVRRGDVAVHITETCVASDIVVIAAPLRMGTTHAAQVFSDTALRSAASVLFLPPRRARPHGVIAVVAVSAADPAVDVARHIAASEREALLVVTPVGSEAAAEGTIRLLSGSSVQDVMSALGYTRERMIVLTRGSIDGSADLAVARGVPVLVLEPVSLPSA